MSENHSTFQELHDETQRTSIEKLKVFVNSPEYREIEGEENLELKANLEKAGIKFVKNRMYTFKQLTQPEHTQVKPIGKFLMVKSIAVKPSGTTESGIILTGDEEKLKCGFIWDRGEIVKIGDKVEGDYKVGDVIVLKQHIGQPQTITHERADEKNKEPQEGDVVYVLVNEDHIAAILEL